MCEHQLRKRKKSRQSGESEKARKGRHHSDRKLRSETRTAVQAGVGGCQSERRRLE